MKKNILILIAVMAMAGVVNAQEGGFNRSVRLGYGIAGPTSQTSMANHTAMQIAVEADLLNIGKNLSAGAYFGYSPYVSNAFYPMARTPMLRFGIGLHYHLLAAAGINSDKFDLTLNGNIGTSKLLRVNDMGSVDSYVSVALDWYPFQHWGIFAEYGWGQYYSIFENPAIPTPIVGGLTYPTILKAGVSFRF